MTLIDVIEPLVTTQVAIAVVPPAPGVPIEISGLNVYPAPAFVIETEVIDPPAETVTVPKPDS